MMHLVGAFGVLSVSDPPSEVLTARRLLFLRLHAEPDPWAKERESGRVWQVSSSTG
jgi:hypothetical protein